MSRIDALRSELGGASPAAVKKVKDHLDEYVQGYIRHAPFAVLSTCNDRGDCDASPRGGRPGFVAIVNDRTLLLPDIGGNRLFQSYQNLEANPRAALLFMIPGSDVTARVNGRVTLVDRADLQARGVAPSLYWSDANSHIVQGLLLAVDEAYLHCPRSFQFADLWNPRTIATNRGRSLKDLAGS